MANLSGNELNLAQRWLTTLFYWGELAKGQTKDYARGYGSSGAAMAICDEIKNRQFNFVKDKLDDKLQAYINSIQKIRTQNGGYATRGIKACADYIAWFCKENNIIWDDTNKTQYEMDAIKSTILGNALYEAGCFKNTQPNATAKPATQATTRTVTQRQPGQPPVNGYKGSGPHSKDIPNLVSNGKVNLGGRLLCIEADKVGKNTPNAFITPLKANTSGIVQVAKAQAETVNMGSGNGYTDCRLWFDDYVKAQDFLAKVQAKFGNKFNNIHLAYKSADSNGYFMVSTEFGDAYIKAAVLNEEVEAPAENKKIKHIDDVEIYAEWMQRSIS